NRSRWQPGTARQAAGGHWRTRDRMASLLPRLLLLLVFGIFAVAVVHVLRARADAGKGMPPFSVYSEEGDGLAAAAQVLRRLGFEPVALSRPIQDTRHRGLLILAEPEAGTHLTEETGQLSDLDTQALLAWVKQGNTILLLGRHMTSLHRALGVEIATDLRAASGDRLPRKEIVLSRPRGYTAGISRLEVEGTDTLRVSDNSRADAQLPLWM